jgi:hypothetical protein
VWHQLPLLLWELLFVQLFTRRRDPECDVHSPPAHFLDDDGDEVLMVMMMVMLMLRTACVRR